MIVLVKTLIGITIGRDDLIGRLAEADDTDVDIDCDVDDDNDHDHDSDDDHDAYYDADADSGSHQRGTSHPAENPMWAPAASNSSCSANLIPWEDYADNFYNPHDFHFDAEIFVIVMTIVIIFQL